MKRIVARRVLSAIPTILGVIVLLFFVLRLLPGNPVAALLAGAPATPHEVSVLESHYGLDRPLLDQFGSFLWAALHGNFGLSYSTNEPVYKMVVSQAIPTIELTIVAMVLTVVAGILLGILAAMFRNSWLDSTIRVLSLLGTSMPSFWTGNLLILAFAFALPIFPASGTGGFSSIVLPAVSLAFFASGVVIRLIRNSMVELYSHDFVTALYARGLGRWRIQILHVFRNALIPSITIVGLQTGALLSGAVIIEAVFSRQGLGTLLVTAVETKDYPLVQGTAVFIALAYVTINVLVDISYAFVDPRVHATLTGK